MPQGERTVLYSYGEQWKTGSSTLKGGTDNKAYIEVNVDPGHATLKSKTPSPKSGRGVTEEVLVNGNPELLLAASVTTPPRLPTFLISFLSWVAQAFQYALSEGGMALTTAFVLFLISLAGSITLYLVAPARTTAVVGQLGAKLASIDGETPGTLLADVMPEVLTLLQSGLQVMLIPGLLVGFSGVFILGNVDRRRPGCWTTTYGCAAVLLGLALLYLLLRVVFGGNLRGLRENMNKSLYEVWSMVEEGAAPCQWESIFPCSGFHWCCVTNTTELSGDNAWDSICFATLPNHTALLKDGRDITSLVNAQCGVLKMVNLNSADVAPFTTACALTAAEFSTASTRSSSPAARLATCENYVVGHLTSTVGFALYLALGMSVCSLVSGVVTIVQNLQRTRTSDFILVNNPAGAVSESSMTIRGKH